jgi:hypothetical protein
MMSLFAASLFTWKDSCFVTPDDRASLGFSAATTGTSQERGVHHSLIRSHFPSRIAKEKGGFGYEWLVGPEPQILGRGQEESQ